MYFPLSTGVGYLPVATKTCLKESLATGSARWKQKLHQAEWTVLIAQRSRQSRLHKTCSKPVCHGLFEIKLESFMIEALLKVTWLSTIVKVLMVILIIILND